MAGKFESTLRDFKNDIDGSRVSVHQMVKVLNNRGYGVLLLLLCLLEILPTGAIPGVPSLIGTIIILVSSQLLINRHHIWVPDFVGRKTLDYDKVQSALDYAIPFVRKLDKVTKERLQFFTSTHGEKASAALIITIALTFYPLELVPFASSIPAFIIAIFGISFVAKDGLICLIAWITALFGAGGIAYILMTNL